MQANNPDSGHNISVSKRLNTLLHKLYGLHPKLIDLSLTRVLRFLNELDNPHLKLPPVIHVAGTNGKGSTIAIMKAILEAHAKTVHVATSPHLIKINERIVLAGREIDDERLADLIEICIEKNNGQDITFFEMIMAVTFLAFSQESADFCLIETGLGGRLDATNVIPNPAAAIITSISMDHQEFLGGDLQTIAGEKAGIIKKDVPCIIGKQSEEAMNAGVIDTFQSQALSTGATLRIHGADWRCEMQAGQMRFKSGSVEYMLHPPSLLGTHQIHNAGAAIEALRVMRGLELDPQKMSTGLGQVHWPARLQKLDHQAFDRIKDMDCALWLDGGHNESAGEILAAQMRDWHDDGAKEVHVILGMMTRKNPAAFAAHFTPYARSITSVPITGESGAFTPKALKEDISSVFDGTLYTAESVTKAIDNICDNNKKIDHILICGSLYLAGQVLSAIKTP